jgi:hypothetical protein
MPHAERNAARPDGACIALYFPDAAAVFTHALQHARARSETRRQLVPHLRDAAIEVRVAAASHVARRLENFLLDDIRMSADDYAGGGRVAQKGVEYRSVAAVVYRVYPREDCRARCNRGGLQRWAAQGDREVRRRPTQTCP